MHNFIFNWLKGACGQVLDPLKNISPRKKIFFELFYLFLFEKLKNVNQQWSYKIFKHWLNLRATHAVNHTNFIKFTDLFWTVANRRITVICAMDSSTIPHTHFFAQRHSLTFRRKKHVLWNYKGKGSLWVWISGQPLGHFQNYFEKRWTI